MRVCLCGSLIAAWQAHWQGTARRLKGLELLTLFKGTEIVRCRHHYRVRYWRTAQQVTAVGGHGLYDVGPTQLRCCIQVAERVDHRCCT